MANESGSDNGNEISLEQLLMNLATSGNQKHVQLASDLLELDLIQDNLGLNGSNKNEKELTLDNNVKSDNLGPDCLDMSSLSANGNQNSEHESDMDWTTVRHKNKRTRTGSNDAEKINLDVTVSDLLAKNACKNEMIQIQVPLNKTEINKDIHLKYQTIWETQYNTNNKGQFFKSIEPNVKNIQIINLQNKHMETILYRLRTGHNRLNMHLHKIGLHNSGLCDFCEEPETVKHYLLDCLKYQQYQENLIDFANKNNVKLTIESILNKRDMFPLIYDYVLKTKKEI